jgi:hypothetical protein
LYICLQVQMRHYSTNRAYSQTTSNDNMNNTMVMYSLRWSKWSFSSPNLVFRCKSYASWKIVTRDVPGAGPSHTWTVGRTKPYCTWPRLAAPTNCTLSSLGQHQCHIQVTNEQGLLVQWQFDQRERVEELGSMGPPPQLPQLPSRSNPGCPSTSSVHHTSIW